MPRQQRTVLRTARKKQMMLSILQRTACGPRRLIMSQQNGPWLLPQAKYLLRRLPPEWPG